MDDEADPPIGDETCGTDRQRDRAREREERCGQRCMWIGPAHGETQCKAVGPTCVVGRGREKEMGEQKSGSGLAGLATLCGMVFQQGEVR